MDIVLKENDVKRMLGEALGVEIAPEDMIVNKEPFTVTIENAEVYLAKGKKEPALQRKNAPPEKPEDPEEPDNEVDPSADDSPLVSLDDLHRQSMGLAGTPPETGSETKRAMSAGGRSLRPNETATTPPPTERGREKQ